MNDITVGDKTKFVYIKDMVKDYLVRNHYSGLSMDDCGCGLDDFAPCDEGPYPECIASKEYVLQDGEHLGDSGPGDIVYIPVCVPITL